MATAYKSHTTELLIAAKPYLFTISEEESLSGTIKITCTFNKGEITRIDVSTNEQSKAVAQAPRGGTL
jgi:hypothetical protein